MSETLYFLIFGNPKAMKKAFPKNSQFYEMEQIFLAAPKLYGLAFLVEKSKSLHPMVQGAMCVPGSWNMDSDLRIVNDLMAEFGKPEDRHRGKGLHIDRYETAEDINAELSRYHIKMIWL